MKRNRFVAILAFSSIFFCGASVLAAADQDSGSVLAKVGDQQLTLAKLESHIKTLPPQLQDLLNKNASAKEQMVNSWVEMTLWAKEAEAMGLEKTPEVQMKLNDMRNSVMAMAAKEAVTQKVQVTAEELEKYFAEHKTEFAKGEEVRAQHILVRMPENANPDEEAAARKTIKEIQEKLAAGESFATLASTYSDDPGSKSKGGDLGYFGRGRMVPEFEAAAFNTPVDTVSEPVRSKFGLHLIKVNERKDGEEARLEDVSDKIDASIKSVKQQAAVDKIMEELKAKYPVTINLEQLRGK